MRRSKIHRLAPELRAELDRLLADGRWSVRDITDHLRSLGADVSKSAVGRYAQEFEEIARDIRETRELAAAMARELGALPDGDATRVLVESLHALIFKVCLRLGREDATAEDVMFVARAVRDLQATLKSSVDMEMKVRDRVLQEAAAAAVAEGTERGLSQDTVDGIRGRILGMRKRP